MTHVIVGAGVFGLSLALELVKESGVVVTLVDRHYPPVPHAASVDSSRIVRADYADPYYSALAKEAQEVWRSDTELRRCYHESGFRIMADLDDRRYLEQAAANVHAAVTVRGAIKEYTNPTGGWVDAEAAMRVLVSRMERCESIEFVKGDVVGHSDGRTVLSDGRVLEADRTVLCTGAWQTTGHDVPTLATGQAMAYITVDAEQEARLAKMPVTMHLSSGWFVLPPSNGEIKVARHATGYTRHVDGKSTPWMGPIPRDAEESLREGLRRFMPELATAPFSRTRLCWYSDTPTSDFLVYAPSSGPWVATGGSGHAFKFLPVLGRELLDTLLGRGGIPRSSLGHALAGYGRFVLPDGSTDGSRGRAPRQELPGG